MNTSYDRFMRTTDPDHEVQIQKIFKKLYEKGDIYKGHYEGMYCTPCESFWTKSQLKDGKCPDCGRLVQPAKEEAYFFKMSKYAPMLIKYIEDHPDFIQPEARKNEMINTFLKPGLQDLCVSRTTFKWGIPVDFDPKHVIYVWIDALCNYITGIGYNADLPYSEQSDYFKKYWPAQLHLIGKDILRFHTIYWPIMLMALDLPLPEQVFGHPWLLQGDGKMSKSKGNVLYADDMVNLFGVDAVRYFLLHDVPFESDGIISWELLIERINSDLANTLGNLVNRTISMSNKYFGGVVTNTNVSEPVDQDLKDYIYEERIKVNQYMDKLRVSDSLTEVFNIFKRLNKYIDETTPWALAKEEDKLPRLNTVLYNLTEGIVMGASLLHSFLPETAEKIASMLNADLRSVIQLTVFGLYPSGNKVTDSPEILFERIDVEKAMEFIHEKFPVKEEKPEKIKPKKVISNEPATIARFEKPAISVDEFDRMQLEIGEILKCESVPESKKLLCSQVQVGGRVLQIVSGIKKFYNPEEMVGKKVVVITNLEPAKLAGVESQGMLLCAENAEGRLALLTCERPDEIEGGSMIS